MGRICEGVGGVLDGVTAGCIDEIVTELDQLGFFLLDSSEFIDGATQLELKIML